MQTYISPQVDTFDRDQDSTESFWEMVNPNSGQNRGRVDALTQWRNLTPYNQTIWNQLMGLTEQLRQYQNPGFRQNFIAEAMNSGAVTRATAEAQLSAQMANIQDELKAASQAVSQAGGFTAINQRSGQRQDIPVFGPEITGPDGQPFTPVIGSVNPTGTVSYFPTPVLEQILPRTVSPDQVSRAAESAANRGATAFEGAQNRASSAARSAEATARNQASITAQQRLREMAEAGAMARKQLDYRSSILGASLRNGELTEKQVENDLKLYQTRLDNLRNSYETVLREGNVYDDRQVRVWAEQGKWDQQEAEIIATLAKDVYQSEMTKDNARYRGQVDLRGQDIDIAKAIALKMVDGFAATLKDYIPGRSDMADVIQKGLVAVAAGKRVPKEFRAAFDLGPDFTQKEMGRIYESALRNVLGRPDGPLLPPHPEMVDRPRPTPYQRPERIAPPVGVIDPDLIGRMAAIGEGGGLGVPDIERLREEGASGPLAQELSTSLSGFGADLMARPGGGSFAMPLGMPDSPMGLGAEEAEVIDIAPMDVEGPTYDYLDMGGGEPEAFYRSPLDAEQEWNEPDHNPIIAKIDELAPYMDAETMAGTGLAWHLILDQDFDPQDAWETSFPGQPWRIGEDSYDLSDWEGQDWYA